MLFEKIVIKINFLNKRDDYCLELVYYFFLLYFWGMICWTPVFNLIATSLFKSLKIAESDGNFSGIYWPILLIRLLNLLLIFCEYF
jgi:hypothetical protein